MATEKMPEWPNRDDYVITPANPGRGTPEYADDESYECDRADAALARLKVAVAALRDIRGPYKWKGPCYETSDVYMEIASDALSLIGEIPE